MSTHGFPWTLLGLTLAVLIFLACYQQSLRRVVETGFGAISRVLGTAIEYLASCHPRLWGVIERELTRIHLAGESWRAMYVVGAVVHTFVFLFLALCDFHSVSLTLSAMTGGRSSGLWFLPFSVESTLAFAVLLSGVYSGWMIKEFSCEKAALIPLQHYTPGSRKWMRAASAASLLLIAVVVYEGGDFRGEILAPAQGAATAPVAAVSLSKSSDAAAAPLTALANPTPPSPRKARAIRITMWALPLALLLSALVAFVGPALLCKLLIPGLISTAIGWIWWTRHLLAALRSLLQAVWAIFGAALQLVLRVAITVARPLITLFRSLADWAFEQQRSNATRSGGKRVAMGLIAGLVLPFSSWAWDTEVPRHAIGGEHLSAANAPQPPLAEPPPAATVAHAA